ncbi:MAG: hypothetical protein KBE09_01935 [Candidatus Pacebacteria bacterium]|nr:hypothetical protein [Candidatus Paceibacterota bacterium]
MAGESYLSKKYGKTGPTTKRFTGVPVSVEHPVQSEHTVDIEADGVAQEHLARIRAGVVAELKTKLAHIVSADPESIDKAVAAYLSDPELQKASQAGVAEIMSQSKELDADAFAERLANDAAEVAAAAESGAEIPANNILMPLLVSQGAVEIAEQDATAAKSLQHTKVASRPVVGPLGTVKLVAGKLAVPIAATVNIVIAAADTAVIEKAGEGMLTDMGVEGTARTATALGASLGINAFLLRQKMRVKGRPGALGYVTWIGDMTWGATKEAKISGALTVAALAVATPLIFGNAVRGTVDAGVGGEIGGKMKAAYSPERDAIKQTIDQARSLFTTIKPAIDRKKEQALNAVLQGFGRRSWGASRVLEGRTQEADRKYVEFTKQAAPSAPQRPTGATPAPTRTEAATPPAAAEDPRLAPARQALAAAESELAAAGTNRQKQATARQKIATAKLALQKLEQQRKGPTAAAPDAAPAPEDIETRLSAINARYGLEPGDGAEQLLKKLTSEIDKVDPLKTFAALDALLRESKALEESGILENIFGGVAAAPSVAKKLAANVGEFVGERKLSVKEIFTKDVPWEDVLHNSSGTRALFKSESKFRDETLMALARQLQQVTVSATLSRYLDEVHQQVGVDVRMDIPSTIFTLTPERVAKLGIDRSPYATIVDKTVWDYVAIPAADSPIWGYIGQSLKQNGISIDTSTPEGQNKALGLLVAFILTLLAGSALATVTAKKLKRSWVEEQPLEKDEKRGLFTVETEIAEDMVRLMRERETGVFASLAKESGVDLQHDDRDDVTLTAILQRQLRTAVLAGMQPPMHTTPAGQAFINRQHHIGNRALRDLYARTLNEFIATYKEDRIEGVKKLLQSVDGGRSEELAKLQAFITQLGTTTSTPAARENIVRWYRSLDAKFRQEEIRAREGHVQELYARREALLQLRPVIEAGLLDKEPTSIQPADIIHLQELMNIDSLIEIQHAALLQISQEPGKRVPRDTAITYSSDQVQNLEASIQARELTNELQGADLTAVAEEYQKLITGLKQRAPVIERALRESMSEELGGATIDVEYRYNPRLPGLTVAAEVSRPGRPDLTIWFSGGVPNTILNSDEAIIAAFEAELAPGSKQIEKMKLLSLRDAYLQTTESLVAQLSITGSPIVDLASVDAGTMGIIQQILTRSSIARVQEQLLPIIDAGTPLNSIQRKVFEQPDSVQLAGVWQRKVQEVFSEVNKRYANATSVTFDVVREIFIVADVSGTVEEVPLRKV